MKQKLYDRRNFIKISGLATIGSLLSNRLAASEERGRNEPTSIFTTHWKLK